MSKSSYSRTKSLHKIRTILKLTSSTNPFASSPRVHKAFLVATPIVFASVILSELFVGITIATVVFGLVLNLSSKETWSEQLYKLIIGYQPLDESIYQELLAKIEAGTADRAAVLNWFELETAYVELPNEVTADQTQLTAR